VGRAQARGPPVGAAARARRDRRGGPVHAPPARRARPARRGPGRRLANGRAATPPARGEASPRERRRRRGGGLESGGTAMSETIQGPAGPPAPTPPHGHAGPIPAVIGGHDMLRHGNTLLVEVGGGSADISFLRAGEPVFSGTYALGSIRMRQSLASWRGTHDRRVLLLRRHIHNVVEDIKREMPLRE